jgi:hypothetical protein
MWGGAAARMHAYSASGAAAVQAQTHRALEQRAQEAAEREAALVATHETALAEQAAACAAAAEETAKLQALVDESAAAHKAHAELKELRIKSKCAAGLARMHAAALDASRSPARC